MSAAIRRMLSAAGWAGLYVAMAVEYPRWLLGTVGRLGFGVGSSADPFAVGLSEYWFWLPGVLAFVAAAVHLHCSDMASVMRLPLWGAAYAALGCGFFVLAAAQYANPGFRLHTFRTLEGVALLPLVLLHATCGLLVRARTCIPMGSPAS